MTVTGADSELSVNGPLLRIGNAGNAALTVSAAGQVSAQNFEIGAATNSVSSATITGAGSSAYVPGILAIGGRSDNLLTNGGNAMLTVSAGGTVAVGGTGAPSPLSGATRIGWQSGSVGVLTVTGASSSLSSDFSIGVGNSGNGTLNVTAGGLVQSASTSVGLLLGGLGAVNVTGTDSLYLEDSAITLGSGGTGYLTVADGAQVQIANGAGILTVGSATSGTQSIARIGAVRRLRSSGRERGATGASIFEA